MDGTQWTAGCAVVGREGPIGTYAGSRPATQANGQAYLLVRLTRLFGLVRRTRMVPFSWVVTGTSGGRVTLDATRAQVTGCPPLRSDAAIQEDVEQVLFTAAGHFEVSTIRPSVAGGVVQLRGHSAHRTAARRALASVTHVPGVLAMHDDSYEDGALIVAVAQALTQEPGPRAATLLVTSRLGKIGLSGTVPTERVRQRATALAQAVPGVVQVHNAAIVRTAAQPRVT